MRYAARSLARYPGYTAVVLLTLALGIGANTAIFSVVHAVLLRPLPYTHGDRLVEVRQQAPRIGVANAGVSVKEIQDYRAQTPSFDAIVEYHQMSFNLLGRGEASRVQTGVVSPEFFDVLGVKPILGRTFRADDDSPNAPAVLLVSYSFWQNALGGDTGIVGRAFEMNDRMHTVVGVLPPIPQFPGENDVYMPPSACPFRSNPQTIANRQGRMLTAIGRLRPDATLDRVQNDLAVVSDRLNREYPADYDAAHTGFHAAAASVRDELTRDARPTLLILLATTGFVLLLVAANVANLALARVLGRQRELAVRTALGAGRGRIARQLLDREHDAGGRRRRARPRLRVSGSRPARRVHVALHAARRRDLHRRHGARLHTRRLGLHGAAVRTIARGHAPDGQRHRGGPPDGRQRAAWARATR